ncbi:hypothetical protein QBC34DRAFT_430335 [Podospora aff. communis PSN243]|uniref:Uncharacterized protein n=1 Tax=Podospora aff. communis PSN243 TaxID=3040156 RepID=A0AAV9G8U5_9PEZI|nr:hypothetical protein QBC34DRAFT_430335 [Podospora aff. communis PSN243]
MPRTKRLEAVVLEGHKPHGPMEIALEFSHLLIFLKEHRRSAFCSSHGIHHQEHESTRRPGPFSLWSASTCNITQQLEKALGRQTSRAGKETTTRRPLGGQNCPRMAKFLHLVFRRLQSPNREKVAKSGSSSSHDSGHMPVPYRIQCDKQRLRGGGQTSRAHQERLMERGTCLLCWTPQKQTTPLRVPSAPGLIWRLEETIRRKLRLQGLTQAVFQTLAGRQLSREICATDLPAEFGHRQRMERSGKHRNAAVTYRLHPPLTGKTAAEPSGRHISADIFTCWEPPRRPAPSRGDLWLRRQTESVKRKRSPTKPRQFPTQNTQQERRRLSGRQAPTNARTICSRIQPYKTAADSSLAANFISAAATTAASSQQPPHGLSSSSPIVQRAFISIIPGLDGTRRRALEIPLPNEPRLAYLCAFHAQQVNLFLSFMWKKNPTV